MKIDVLAFGAHPDDVELSCAGVLLVEKSKSRTTGIIDLTRGELGTRGSVEMRNQESALAADILGVDVRENLDLKDGFFENNEEAQRKVIQVIRKYQPEVILCNAPSDRHPDHKKGAQLIRDAAFLSSLVKIETQVNGHLQAPWRPSYVFNYIQDKFLNPDFVIDITEVFDNKMKSILAYASQFYQEGMSGPQTYISKPEFMENHINRHRLLGKMIGVTYAEGFLSEKMIGFNSLEPLIKIPT